MSGVTCPYLGLVDDAETALAYPSPWNCCFRHGAPVSVTLEHQRNYCLATAYVGCPVYLDLREKTDLIQGGEVLKEQKKIVRNLEKERNLKPAVQRQIPTKNLVLGLGALLILLMLIWGVVWGKELLNTKDFLTMLGVEKSAMLTPLPVKSNPTVTRTSPSISAVTRVVLISESDTQVATTTIEATPTQTVKWTPTSTKKAAEVKKTQSEATSTSSAPTTAMCGAPAGWVQYVVRQGDTLSGLSRALGVSVAQLQTANCMGNSTQLYAGTVIYVPFYPPVNTVKPTNTAVPPTKTPVPPTKTSVPPTDTTGPTATSVPASSTPVPTETQILPTETQEIILVTETVETAPQ